MSEEGDVLPNGLHFCVLIHGLWGDPKHLNNVAKALNEAHPEKTFHLLITKSNVGNFTYDGIETGAERVTQEIEQELERLAEEGAKVTKISFIGYSLGGLIARYTIGLLYSKGIFEKIEPVNFTTFATPHLGVRTPLLGWQNQLWNAVGGKTLSASGHQLWLIDKFRDTDRPLLAVLADPDSIFIKALAAFKKRTLYSNIINDRAVPFYTSFISRTDPFTDLNEIEINYDPAYEQVILDANCPAKPRTQALTLYQALAGRSSTLLVKAPFYLFIGLFAPIFGTAFFVNAGIQSFQSAQRIKLHEEGQAGVSHTGYRIPLMIEGIQRRTEEAFEKLNRVQSEEFLPAEDQPNKNFQNHTSQTNGQARAAQSAAETLDGSTKPSSTSTQPLQADFPHLALTPEQLTMIETLDSVGFTKHAVHIHRASHSHAAIIVRTNRIGFGEGKIVTRHFVERFEV